MIHSSITGIKRFASVFTAVVTAISVCASSMALTAFAQDTDIGSAVKSAATDYEGLTEWTGYTAKTYAGGTGTSSDPYLISCGEELALFRSEVNHGNTYINTYFKMTSDILLNDDLTTDVNTFWLIGDNYNMYYFRGTFDGDGHKIIGLYYPTSYSEANKGLFTVNYGTIKNLTLSGGSLVLGGNDIGSICGYNYGSIINCHSDCDIEATRNADNITPNDNIGGICGYNAGTVDSCTYSGTINVTGGYYDNTRDCIGGITGFNYGYIVNCWSDAIIIAGTYSECIGGISGHNGKTVKNSFYMGSIRSSSSSGDIGGISGNMCYNASIVDCYNLGDITASTGPVGGICGDSGNSDDSVDTYGRLKIKGCFNKGDITSVSSAGGICGAAENTDLEDCYSTGNITSDYCAAGICYDFDSSTAVRCYNTGTMNASSPSGGLFSYMVDSEASLCYNTGDIISSGDRAGGIVGRLYSGSLANCYNTGDVTGFSYVGGIWGENYTATNSISDCYTAGNVTGTGTYAICPVGEVYGVISDVYYNSDICTLTVASNNAYAKTTEQLTASTAITDLGFDAEVWNKAENTALNLYYPDLAAFDTDAPRYKVPVPCPEVTATAGIESVQLTWEAVAQAEEYRVSYILDDEITVAGKTTETAYTIEGLTGGTEYGFVVQAYVNDEWTEYTDEDIVYATPEKQPEIKPAVTATAGAGQVSLKWDAIDGATNYNVYIYTTGYKLLTSTTSTSYTATGLTGGTKYGFLVRAYVNGTWTAFSNDDLVYATPTAASAKPVVTATEGAGQVALKWDAIDGATNYNVYIYTTGYKLLTSTTSTSYTATGLTAGTKYGFLVRAYVNGAWTAFTNDDLVYATPTAASAKPVVTATAGAGQVALKWDAIDGATNYNVYIYTTGYKLLTSTTSTSYTATGLTGGTKYGFLVRAYVNGAWTEFTNADLVYATPTAASAKPVVTATAGAGQVALKWDAIDGATNYNVYIYTTGYKLLTSTTSTSYTATGLTAGTKYGFLVRAYVNGAWTAFTNDDLVYATPTAASAKPVVTATAGAGQVVLKWNAVSGATNYRVFSYLNGKYAVLGETTSTSYTATGLTAGTKYGFLVRAYVNGAWTAFTNDDLVYATPTAASAKPVVTVTPMAGEALIRWNAVSGATNYRVFTYLNGKYTEIGTTTSASYIVSGLTSGTKYGFLVRAYVNGTWTAFTNNDVVYAEIL